MLLEAVSSVDAGAVRARLAAGHDVHTADGTGRTPLHAAAAGGWADGVRLLLGAGARAGARDRAGQRPLDVVRVARATGAGRDAAAAQAQPDAT
jgi:uncharacterized protein